MKNRRLQSCSNTTSAETHLPHSMETGESNRDPCREVPNGIPSRSSHRAVVILALLAFLLVPGVLGAAIQNADSGTADKALGLSETLRTGVLAIAAGLAIALSVIGAGYAVGRIGSAALGAAAEKPELLIRSLLFVALAEGLAVLGFAIAMMLVQKI